MNLIQMILEYGRLMENEGSEAAEGFLKDTGVDKVVRFHIRKCFPHNREEDPQLYLTLNGCPVPMLEVRLHVQFEEAPNGGGDSLLLNLTHEGLITDAFVEGMEESISSGQMYLDIFERMRPKPVNEFIARLQEKYAGEDGSLLDEAIIEQFTDTASAYNNEGIESQIEQLVQHMGEEGTETFLRETYGR